MKKILFIGIMFFITSCSMSHNKNKENILLSYPQIKYQTKYNIKKQKKVVIDYNKEQESTRLVWSNDSNNINSKVLCKKVKRKSGEKIDVDLEYHETDIFSVIKQIMGDILNLNYSVHPRIKGVVNLKISGKYTKDEILNILSHTFELLGITILKKDNLYEIVPSSDSLKFSSNTDNICFYVYMPKFVSTRDIQSIIRHFLSYKGKSFINLRNNFIIVEDSQENINYIEKIIKTIDINFLSNKYIRVYKLLYSDAKDIERDISSFMIGMGIPKNQGKYIIIPVSRLNYLIVVTSEKSILNQIDSFIKLLDVGEKNAKKEIYIYKVQYVKAKDLANTLISFFTGKQKIEVKKKQGKTVSRISSNILSEEAVIIPDETTNYLLIEATPSDYEKIMKLIKPLDAMPRQVLIEVLIAEVSLNKEFEHGIEWWLRNNKDKYTFSSGINYGLSGKQDSLLGFTYYGMTPDKFWNFMYFLNTRSSLQILSSPHITVRDNTKATINIGSEVPVATGETIGNVQASGSSAIERRIQYKNVGTILSVTPHISEDGFVTMEIEQEVSDAKSNTVSGIDSPIISTRKTKTTLMVQDNHSIVIGGIIKHKRDKTRKYIPILGDIPYLGKIFSYESTNKEDTELIVMITPHVIRTPDDADIITNIFKNRLTRLKQRETFKQ